MKTALYGIEKGLQTMYSLLREGVYIDAICFDNNEEHYSILGKPCISYNEIKSNCNEWRIIISPNRIAEETCYRMINDGINVEIYRNKLDERLFIDDLAIDSLSICFFLKEYKSRDIFILGTDERAKEFVKKMQFLDFNVKGFLSTRKEQDKLLGVTVYSIFEILLWDNNPMIVISSATKEVIELLNSIGMKYGNNYCLMSSLRLNERRGNRNAVWDLNLGHTYIDTSSIPKGFVRYGCTTPQKRIVILGGSTSDSYYTWFSSWPEILHSMFCEKGYQIEMLNGAMCGYNIQQEFLKLIRDVLPLKPDIVIDFSGTNNVGTARVSPENPFVPYYLLDISKKLDENLIQYSKQNDDMMALNDQTNVEKVFLGNAVSDSCATSYVNTLRMMNAVCKEFGIFFVSFFQPNIWTKYGTWDKWEKEIVFCSSVSDLNGDLTDFRLKRSEDFSNEVLSMFQDFQNNLIDLFRNEYDVYMDTDHYTLKANKIIAKQVFDYIISLL